MAGMLKKSDLVDKIAEQTTLTKKDVEKVLNAFVETTISTVAEGTPVQIAGFGTFERRERSERTGRNLQTGEEIIVPATKTVGFKALSAFKKAVKGE